jgi:hypothetical protein
MVCPVPSPYRGRWRRSLNRLMPARWSQCPAEIKEIKESACGTAARWSQCPAEIKEIKEIIVALLLCATVPLEQSDNNSFNSFKIISVL